MSDSVNYAPQPKKSKVGLIVTIVVLVLALCCVLPIALIAGFGIQAVGNGKGMIGCAISMTDLRDGLMDYAKAHNGKFPPAATWQDDISEYVKTTNSAQGFEIPTPADSFCDKNAVTAVSFNSDLAGQKLASIKEPEDTIILFEVAGKGRNLSGKYQTRLPAGSPKLVFGIERGWIEAPIKGDLGIRRKEGLAPINGMNSKQFRRNKALGGVGTGSSGSGD